jgi:hypothetical protein
MTSLALRKCLNHAEREAAARCPECQSFFCRECVSEHRGRVLCAACLGMAAAASSRSGRWKKAWLPVGAIAGIGLAWACFALLGRILLAIPAAYHDGAWTHGGGKEAAQESGPAGAGGNGAGRK